MFCTRCGKQILEDSKFCSSCGAQLVTVEVEIRLPQTGPVPAQPQYAPVYPPVTQKKGSLRVPVLILAVLCVIGLVLFALFPGESSGTSPQAVGKGNHFTIDDGCLFFDESLYTGLEELTVPETVDGETVTCICERCFYDCDSLTTVKLPDTLKSIGFRAFYDCDNLRGILIPEGVYHIAGEAFAWCPELEAVSIPATVESIETSAFDECPSLKYVFFSGTVAQWNSIFDGCYDSDAIVYCSDGECLLEWGE